MVLSFWAFKIIYNMYSQYSMLAWLLQLALTINLGAGSGEMSIAALLEVSSTENPQEFVSSK